MAQRVVKSRGKDGMFKRFSVEAMQAIDLLVPTFNDEREANKFYQRVIKLKKFKDLAEIHLSRPLPNQVVLTNRAYRCTAHAEFDTSLTLGNHRNGMQILHLLAHFYQPEDTAWHGGEFGSTFLDLVGRIYGPDTRREVKSIMVEKRLKTSFRSQEANLRQSQAYYTRRVGEIPKGLIGIMNEIKGLADDG